MPFVQPASFAEVCSSVANNTAAICHPLYLSIDVAEQQRSLNGISTSKSTSSVGIVNTNGFELARQKQQQNSSCSSKTSSSSTGTQCKPYSDSNIPPISNTESWNELTKIAKQNAAKKAEGTGGKVRTTTGKQKSQKSGNAQSNKSEATTGNNLLTSRSNCECSNCEMERIGLLIL